MLQKNFKHHGQGPSAWDRALRILDALVLVVSRIAMWTFKVSTPWQMQMPPAPMVILDRKSRSRSVRNRGAALS